MKKLLILSLGLLYVINAYSQTDWPPIGAQWYYSYTPCSILGCNGSVDEYLYLESVKDTTINDTACKKIIVEYHETSGDVQKLGNEYIYSIEDKVYNYHHGHFYLLYDFSLEVGDTVDLFLGSNCDIYGQLEVDSYNDDSIITHYVTEKDSITINSRRYLYIDYNFVANVESPSRHPFFNYRKIIKGLGSLSFLTGDLTAPIETGDYGPLRCYMDSTISYTKNLPCDTLLTQIENVNNIEKEDIKLYPCPATNRIRIKAPEQEINDLHYQIINNMGQPVSEGKINPKHTIDISMFTEGIYYLIIEGESRIRKKIMKE